MSEAVKKKTTPRKTAAKTATKKVAKKQVVPTTEYAAASHSRHEIELLAYHLWQSRGRRHGEDAHDWLQAEQQLNK